MFPFWLAVACGALGEMDRAFQYLDQAVEEHDSCLLYLSAIPRDIGWRGDPRYEQLLRRIGLAHLAERRD